MDRRFQFMEWLLYGSLWRKHGLSVKILHEIMKLWLTFLAFFIVVNVYRLLNSLVEDVDVLGRLLGIWALVGGLLPFFKVQALVLGFLLWGIWLCLILMGRFLWSFFVRPSIFWRVRLVLKPLDAIQDSLAVYLGADAQLILQELISIVVEESVQHVTIYSQVYPESWFDAWKVQNILEPVDDFIRWPIFVGTHKSKSCLLKLIIR